MKREPGQSCDKELLEKLSTRVDRLADSMEKMRLAEYVEMIDRPRRLLYINFLLGVARGFGMAIGFTVLAALVIYLLQKLIMFNMPIIGDFIADIVKIVQEQLELRR
ncbi:MAG: hypothetical protein H5T98_10080 [Syntrophomonadaceae bacterium]|nr:hypothetical protein [Syntrophomonadaceae bacterium]